MQAAKYYYALFCAYIYGTRNGSDTCTYKPIIIGKVTIWLCHIVYDIRIKRMCNLYCCKLKLLATI